MTQVLDDTVGDPSEIIADLQRKLGASTAELAQRNSEYGERIEQQSATIDVLKVMSASPGDPRLGTGCTPASMGRTDAANCPGLLAAALFVALRPTTTAAQERAQLTSNLRHLSEPANR